MICSRKRLAITLWPLFLQILSNFSNLDIAEILRQTNIWNQKIYITLRLGFT